MEKISGIIPASPRVTKVDLADAPGIRATLPNIDKGVGAVSAMNDHEIVMPTWKSKETRQAAVAAEVANSFFMKSKPDAESEPASARQSEAPPQHLQQPEGLFPKGSFIDRTA